MVLENRERAQIRAAEFSQTAQKQWPLNLEDKYFLKNLDFCVKSKG